MNARFILSVASVLVLVVDAWAQQSQSRIYLRNGETYMGEVVAISDKHVLLRSHPNVVSVERAQISFILPTDIVATTPASASVAAPKKNYAMIEAAPLAKKWLCEFESGFVPANPFTFRFGVKEWRSVGNYLQMGLGTSLQFYRYTMMNANVSVRLLTSRNHYVRPFLEGEAGISYRAHITQVGFNQNMFWNGYDHQFSPVKQVLFGAGLWADTSLGVAFTTKLSFCGTWFYLSERFNPTYVVNSDYFIGSALFSLGFVF